MNTTIEGNDSVSRQIQVIPSPAALNVFWIVVFSFTALISIIGNVLVILVFQIRFVQPKQCQTSLKPYLVNLAVADLIMAIFCMPFTYIDAISFWIFPAAMCPLVVFLQVLSVSGNVFTNVAIGINRFRAIVYPFKPLIKKRVSFWIIACIWILSLLMSSAQLFVSRATDHNGTVHCQELWPTPSAARTYTLLIFTCIYAFPLLLLIVTYTAITITLWRNPRCDDIIASKKKVGQNSVWFYKGSYSCIIDVRKHIGRVPKLSPLYIKQCTPLLPLLFYCVGYVYNTTGKWFIYHLNCLMFNMQFYSWCQSRVCV